MYDLFVVEVPNLFYLIHVILLAFDICENSHPLPYGIKLIALIFWRGKDAVRIILIVIHMQIQLFCGFAL